MERIGGGDVAPNLDQNHSAVLSFPDQFLNGGFSSITGTPEREVIS